MLSTKNIRKLSCEICDYQTDKKSNYINHLKSKRHQKNVSPQQVTVEDKEQLQFYCEPCNFVCCKMSIYEKHLKTEKHNFPNPNIKNDGTFVCKKCFSEYTSRSGLWRHNQKCNRTRCHKQENEDED